MIFGVRYGEGWGEGGPHRRKKFKRRSQVSKKKHPMAHVPRRACPGSEGGSIVANEDAGADLDFSGGATALVSARKSPRSNIFRCGFVLRPTHDVYRHVFFL